MVQWLRLNTSTAGGIGSIPGWGTKIPHALWVQTKEKKKCLSDDPPKKDFGESGISSLKKWK